MKLTLTNLSLGNIGNKHFIDIHISFPASIIILGFHGVRLTESTADLLPWLDFGANMTALRLNLSSLSLPISIAI